MYLPIIVNHFLKATRTARAFRGLPGIPLILTTQKDNITKNSE